MYLATKSNSKTGLDDIRIFNSPDHFRDVLEQGYTIKWVGKVHVDTITKAKNEYQVVDDYDMLSVHENYFRVAEHQKNRAFELNVIVE